MGEAVLGGRDLELLSRILAENDPETSAMKWQQRVFGEWAEHMVYFLNKWAAKLEKFMNKYTF